LDKADQNRRKRPNQVRRDTRSMRAADEIVKGIRFALDVQKFVERWALLIINDRGMINNRESEHFRRNCITTFTEESQSR